MQNNLCPTCQSPIAADAPGAICPACALLGVANPTSPTQAAAASVPTLDELGAAFPELEIMELIGQGGMGVVFKARQPKLERFVALKILTPALATQPGFSERFTREARALAKLSHPNIVAVHDFGESGGFFYLLMEFVDGVNLRQAMRAGVSPEQALLLVPKVCEALQFAHDHGVLHRDIKPENILLDTRGVPKLADFGIAKFVGTEGTKETKGTPSFSSLTLSGAQLGTAAYMAPEQIEQPASVDHRADIYSLGVVLYEMLTGELPLGRFAAPSEKSHCSSGVDDVVLRALEKQRERRQQSATEMKTQVEGAATAPPSPPEAPPGYAPFSTSAGFGLALVIAGIWPFAVAVRLILGRPGRNPETPIASAIESFARSMTPLFGSNGNDLAFFAFFGSVIAIIGTALAWKAVSDCRYHRGYLRGGGTAVVAALAVPIVGVLTAFDSTLADFRRGGVLILFGCIASMIFLIRCYPAYKRALATMRAGNSERRAAQ